MPKFDLETLANDLSGTPDRFWQAWEAVRICPHQIEAPKEVLSFNVLAMAISLVIFAVARSSIAVADSGLAADLLANVISTVIMFGSGYFVIAVYPGASTVDLHYKWGLFFIMIWLTSIMLMLVVDAIPFMAFHKALTAALADSILPARFAPWLIDLWRAFAISCVAVMFMTFKSWRIDRDIRLSSSCAVVSIGLALFLNSLLVEAFLYGYLI